MYVARVPNRTSPPAILLRESYRIDGRVKSRTLQNLSDWPEAKIEALQLVLRDEAVGPLSSACMIERSLPHGHVAAVLASLRTSGLQGLLPKTPERSGKLALALIAARVLAPAAKLATARALSEATAAHSLGAVLGLGEVDEDELYAALDCLGEAQPAIEAKLARKHLKNGSLVLYDLTSSYLEGSCCELAQYGYSRDHRRDRPQIVFGVLCASDGCPVAVEVFEGNVGDPSTLSAQIEKLKARFKLDRVILVGDRGMITQARIDKELRPEKLDWITALRAPAIQALAADDGPLQLSLFDERDLAEITSPDYPGERLVVCRNPALARQRAAKREDLLQATEAKLLKIQKALEAKSARLRGKDKIGLAVGAVLDQRKMAKHYRLTITEDALAFERDAEKIAREANLDGIYVVRTNVPTAAMDAGAVVLAYKSLANVERTFRTLKSIDLEVRPIHHRLAGRVRAHVFLCMLAYYVVWHMRQKLAHLLFDDHEPEAAARLRSSPVAKAKISPAAKAKASSKRTPEGLPVHSFRTLMDDLGTLTRNTVRLGEGEPLALTSRPTPLQQAALDALGVRPADL
jgi:Transposase DDE domain